MWSSRSPLDQSIPAIFKFFPLFLRGGPVVPIPEGKSSRIPGFEGTGDYRPTSKEP